MTMYIFLLVSLIVISNGQLFGSQSLIVREITDATFNMMDKNPKDGKITLTELNYTTYKDDVDGDGCVTESEFSRVNHIDIPQFAPKFYKHLDLNNDGCITIVDSEEDLTRMDKSGDGVVTLDEFEPYFVDLMTALLKDLVPIPGTIGK